jgi:hypothetical protein
MEFDKVKGKNVSRKGKISRYRERCENDGIRSKELTDEELTDRVNA